MKKHAYIVYTGGTIGMKPTSAGYAPAPGYLEQQMAAMPEFRDPAMPDYTINEYNPLLDSSNMTPDNWLEIAQDIAEHHEHYDGFLVLHGTDTMAYTASALPFMLQGLRKPVIITGSQIPLREIRNDARDNLITALLIATGFAIPEVCLFFGSKLLRGCRSVKVSAGDFDAFDSPNFPPLGIAGVDIEIREQLLVRTSASLSRIRFQEFTERMVGTLRLFPGISAEIVRNMLQPPLKGLVLETYGVGNAPDRDQDFLSALEEAVRRGLVIVDCTQCLRGTVHLGDYATGTALARAGVISGFDMTTEAALAKLFHLFSAGHSPEEVRRKMQENLRGELTKPGDF
ncbi:MAG: L-asparaginase 1 [Desulfobacteraceae bacterium 4572_88]|nr:MAG: L-asparaginase 1 [Desulfobacteraceae bacterium 4572_88]